MSGMAYMIAGGLVLAASTAGAGIAQVVLSRRKKRIREQYYHIYE